MELIDIIHSIHKVKIWENTLTDSSTTYEIEISDSYDDIITFPAFSLEDAYNRAKVIASVMDGCTLMMSPGFIGVGVEKGVKS